MQIQFLYFEDCPSHETALARLREVLADLRLPDAVEVIRVDSEAQAHELRFPGSPTILVNGNDLFPTEAATYGLMCRAYHLDDGRISPLPTAAMLRAALHAAQLSAVTG